MTNFSALLFYDKRKAVMCGKKRKREKSGLERYMEKSGRNILSACGSVFSAVSGGQQRKHCEGTYKQAN